MNFKQFLLFSLMLGVLSLTGCGGGGGSSAPQAATATLRLSTSGTGTSLAGIGITVTLPAGVTVTTANGAVASGVVAVSGVAAPGTAISVYTPASGGNLATLALAIVSNPTASNPTAVFGTGEFVTITCSRASGLTPQASDFPLSGFNPFDTSGNPVTTGPTGLTASVAVELK
jgi:hypothetical protein